VTHCMFCVSVYCDDFLLLHKNSKFAQFYVSCLGQCFMNIGLSYKFKHTNIMGQVISVHRPLFVIVVTSVTAVVH